MRICSNRDVKTRTLISSAQDAEQNQKNRQDSALNEVQNQKKIQDFAPSAGLTLQKTKLTMMQMMNTKNRMMRLSQLIQMRLKFITIVLKKMEKQK